MRKQCAHMDQVALWSEHEPGILGRCGTGLCSGARHLEYWKSKKICWSGPMRNTCGSARVPMRNKIIRVPDIELPTWDDRLVVWIACAFMVRMLLSVPPS